MNPRLEALHRECRRRGWRLGAVIGDPALPPGGRYVRLEVVTRNHRFVAPPTESIEEQARLLARQLWIAERR